MTSVNLTPHSLLLLEYSWILVKLCPIIYYLIFKKLIFLALSEFLSAIDISDTKVFLPVPTNFILSFQFTNLMTEPRLYFFISIHNF